MSTFVRGIALLLLVSSPLAAQGGRTPPAGGRRNTAPPPQTLKADSSNLRKSPAGYVMDFQDQPLRIVLSAIAEAGNFNVTFANIPTKLVTLRMSTAVSHDELLDAMRGLAESNQLQVTQTGSFLRIEGVPIPTSEQLNAQRQQLQIQQQQALAAQSQLKLNTYRLKHVSAVTIAPVLMNLVIGTGVQRAQTIQVGPGQVITIPNAIQGGNAGGGRGGGAAGGGRGGGAGGAGGGAAANNVVIGGAVQARQAVQAADIQSLASTFLAGGGGGGGAFANQLLQQFAGAAGQQQQQLPAAPGTLSAAANDIRIVAEESTNSLLIRATQSDYQIITQLIQGIDLRPLQVLIEVTIAEVQRNKDLNVGISGSAKKKTKKDTTSGTFPTAASARDFVAMLTGGKGAVSYDVAINALQSRGDVKVLSMPVIIAQNNKEAVLNVGSQRPFVQVSQTVANDPTGRVQTIQYVDVGKKLTITPTINADGYVNMSVDQTDDIATNEIAFDAPVISKRQATTSVFLRNGQTTVIGGLADNDVRKTTSGIPFLSRIPIIGGWLFGNTVENKVTSELFLFLTPHIISEDTDIDQLRDAVKNGSEMMQEMQIDPRIKLQQPLPITPPPSAPPAAVPGRRDTVQTRPGTRVPVRTDTTTNRVPEALGDTSKKIQVPIKRP
ncbi:MAG: secretin N-terminal domain-containing protein [Gemmatimonas sp.]